MKNGLKTVVLAGMFALLQACATANVAVTREAPTTYPKFERISVPPFGNEAGEGLPTTAPENVAGEIMAAVEKEKLFHEIFSTPANHPGGRENGDAVRL